MSMNNFAKISLLNLSLNNIMEYGPFEKCINNIKCNESEMQFLGQIGNALSCFSLICTFINGQNVILVSQKNPFQSQTIRFQQQFSLTSQKIKYKKTKLKKTFIFYVLCCCCCCCFVILLFFLI